MTTKTWRDIAKQVIQKALVEAEAQGLDTEATKAYVNARYPFGERAYHPYKIWLSETKATFSSKPMGRSDAEKLRAWNAGEPMSGSMEWLEAQDRD